MSTTPNDLFLIASSLASASPVGSQNVRAAQGHCRVPAGAWVYPGSNEKRDDVIVALAKRGVVLLGETHDQAAHHHWQLQTIAALFSHRPDMVIGFEMFPRRVQPVLDRWSKGELDETTFFREVDWPRIWGFADELYLPLFHFARMHRLPMLALNIDRTTNRQVAAQGLASVPGNEREGIGDPAPASSSYRDRLFEWFKKHLAAGQDARAASERFERFVCAQQFWDRAMAEAIAGARRDGRRPLVVGIMGSGHIEYGDGVPYQLAALRIDDVATALPWPADTEYPIHDPQIADILFGVAASP